MAPIVHSVEISRRPDEVFAYVTDPSHFAEWQEAVVGANALGPEPPHQGSKVSLTRKVGRREQTMTAELTEFTPPRSYAFRVLDGPVRAFGKGRLEPGSDGDLVLVDPAERGPLLLGWLESAAGWSPYAGMALSGWPVATVLRGRIAYRGHEPEGEPMGRPLRFGP